MIVNPARFFVVMIVIGLFGIVCEMANTPCYNCLGG